MSKPVLYTLIFCLGAVTYSAERWWEGAFYQFMLNRDHVVQVEKTCVDLGVRAARGNGDRETQLFEELGCCYNDGKPEPKGC